MNINHAKQQLAQNGINTAGMSDDEVVSALKSTLISSAIEISTDSELPASPVDATLPQRLVDLFMQSGVDKFKQAIVNLQANNEQDLDVKLTEQSIRHELEIKKAEAQSAGQITERTVTRTVVQDLNGAIVLPAINAVRIDEKPAHEIWPELPASANYTFPICSDSRKEPVPVPFYDMRSLHESGALKIIADAQHEGDLKEHIWLKGEPGTGKTSAVESIAKACGRPFFRISMFKGMEPLSLIGGFLIPDGKSVWADGVLTAAIREPNCVICIDEPDLNPEACEVIQTIIDKGVLNIVDTGETVHVAAGINWLVCANTGGSGDDTGRFVGTEILNKAFIDRFSYQLTVEYMQRQHEIDLVKKQSGCSDLVATQVVEFAIRVRAKDVIDEPISYRRLVAVAILLSRGADKDIAFETAVFPYVSNASDEESYRQIFNAHFDIGA
jgi:hypothetical protein